MSDPWTGDREVQGDELSEVARWALHPADSVAFTATHRARAVAVGAALDLTLSLPCQLSPLVVQ